MKVESWLVVACIALGLSIGLNVYLYTRDESEGNDIELQLKLDRSNHSLDSISIEKIKVDSLLAKKPKQYTVIQRRYVKIHDTIDLRGTVWNDSLFTANLKLYKNSRERFSVNRFPSD